MRVRRNHRANQRQVSGLGKCRKLAWFQPHRYRVSARRFCGYVCDQALGDERHRRNRSRILNAATQAYSIIQTRRCQVWTRYCAKFLADTSLAPESQAHRCACSNESICRCKPLQLRDEAAFLPARKRGPAQAPEQSFDPGMKSAYTTPGSN